MFRIMLTLFGLVCMAPAALAQQTENRNWDASLGIATMSKPEFMGADDQEYRVLPYISAAYFINPQDSFYLKGFGLGYSHSYNESLRTGLGLSLRSDRDSGDDPLLAGMPDLRYAFELGPWVEYTMDPFMLKAALKGDVSGVHGGFVLDMGASYALPLPKRYMANLSLGTSWASEDFMDTYFGVEPGLATSFRPAYSPDAGFYDVKLGADLTYMVTRNWFLRGDAGMTWYMNDAQDSPLMQDDSTLMGLFAVGYRF